MSERVFERANQDYGASSSMVHRPSPPTVNHMRHGAPVSMIDERPAVAPEPGLDRVDPRRPVRGRALWVIFGSLLLLGGLWWGTFNVVELIAHEERTERFTVAAASLDRLLVDNDTGSVTIVGTDTDEISVEAEVSEGLRRTGFRREVVGSTLELHGSCPVIGSMWCRVTYRIEVPRDLDLDVDADDGRVGVSNVDGDLRIESDNGSIELSDVSGRVAVDSDNGRIFGEQSDQPGHRRRDRATGASSCRTPSPPTR